MARFFVIAYTPEDGVATKHRTIADARKAANARTGRFGSWSRDETTVRCAGHSPQFWTKGKEGELVAAVFYAAKMDVDLVLDELGFDATEIREAVDAAIAGPVPYE